MDQNQGGAGAPKLRRRPVTSADFDALVALLHRGFPERSEAYWRAGFARLSIYAPQPSTAVYGHLLEADGVPVGVLLLLPLAVDAAGEAIFSNLSSWYVEPAFCGYAPLLIASLRQNKAATYVNISPAPHTRPVIEAQGFVCYAQGQMFAVPVLAPPRGLSVRRHAPTRDTLPEHDLMVAHAACGCLTLVCDTEHGLVPFVLMRRRVGRGLVPAAQLIYCRDVADVVVSAAALGRWLAKRGMFCLMIDANGPISGLAGKYYAGKTPRYARGPNAPRLGNLAYTELALFGA